MVTLQFHLEEIDDDDAITHTWWIDSPDVDGFYASAPDLVDCRARALEALAADGFDVTDWTEILVVDGFVSEAAGAGGEVRDDAGPGSSGDPYVLTRTPVLVS